MLKSDDYVQILDLYARYNSLIDSRNKAWPEVFTPDGIFSGQSTVTGRDELDAFIERLAAGSESSPFAHTQHWNNNIQLSMDGDEVRGSCYVLRVAHRKETGALEVIGFGHLTDRIVRYEGKWLFAQRTVEHN